MPVFYPICCLKTVQERRESIMKRLVVTLILAGVLLLDVSARAQDDWVLYDDFNDRFLDIDKWSTSERRDGGVMILETSREIHGGRLKLKNRAFGNTASPFTGLRAGDTNLIFGAGEVFTGMETSVKVKEIQVTGCPDSNPTPSSSRARMLGFFFNAGNITTPPQQPGRLNDVLVQIRIQRASDSQEKPQVLDVWADVLRCTDQNCYYASYDGGQPELLGQVLLGQWAKISVEWDVENDQFKVKLNKEPTINIPYGQGWSVYPVSSPYNALGVSNRLASCPPGERAFGFVEAEFETCL